MVARLVPGLALAAAGGGFALLLHATVPALSPTLVAILLGMLLAARGGAASSMRPGLRVASRQVLRVGVALLGLQLVLPEIVALGWPVLLVAAAVVVLGISGTLALARPLGVPPEQALLVACGFSICGAAAVGAVEGVRRSREEDVATVVSLVVVCGSAVMLALPLGAVALGFTPAAAGAWAGASIHEVGQVVVAGGLVGGLALQVAVAVKLARVLMLAPVLAVISYRSRRAAGVRPPLVPAFVVAFLACAVVGAALPAPVLGAATVVQSGALAMAMFALGCSLDVGTLRRTGAPLLILAAAATGLVALLGLPAALLVG
ncbi:putative sulfate exporter family transporter [Nocardioides sp. MAH-18]|uniref:Putative sulfate exporter family transporter n=1 Tax=Nocardioides agri TaxID=2682843 RepID=A0A6L6XSE4_9ACTN|nr:putative sulfate exporter family transporter [Nocardioides sp. CGMCC 1.13656]MBA2954681.1 putative sulfate exporter family transporter [Nocardioides sp. CGMCC 1.13656]MVQ49537.1 putative sulfate exporter family transporter [Nocardioides sp. MAH-18]